MSASAPPARHPRARLLAATLVAVAALTLTACEDGEGLRDEGPAALQHPGTTKAARTTSGRPPGLEARSHDVRHYANAGTSFGFGPYLFWPG
ncbi:hypothetical protein [Streptomyces dysideae]|uniref:hypothetical protein n=1 Tax=Streptomyces dysideae TaxID=909626 RepID=UPI000D155792|nr:hypothetical protein [Streptomyces dysideae]